MISRRITLASVLSAAILLPCSAVLAQDNAATLQKKLETQYPVSKATADKTDLVTPGAVIVLEKDGLLMSATSGGQAASNTYKDGKISQGIWKVAKLPGMGGFMNHSGSTSVQTRTFVAGEKFWITKINIHDDSVVFEILSDPIQDVRYFSTLKFPLAKGSPIVSDQIAGTIADVIKVDDANGGGGNAPQPGSKSGGAPPPPAAAEAPAAPMAPIAPPPPPPDAAAAAPKTIALKQTKEEVVANFGPPTKVVKLGTKEIDYYPDMKVTFVNNKVTDVQ
jgi:hypothetical protein